jgi:glycosyltransferase involved in cell wall biosynthesis/spore maturation protein CgeB
MDLKIKEILKHTQNLIRLGNLTEADRILQESATKHSEHPDILNTRGYLAYQKGDYSSAIDYFDRALQLDRKNADTIYNLVQIYLSLNDPEGAYNFLESFDRKIYSDPEFLRLRDNLYSQIKTVKPVISIIIPAHNHATFLPHAIRSALSQIGFSKEILVVDDGSVDDTRQVVEAFSQDQIRYIYRPKGGEAAACNTGIDRCKGEHIYWLDADDEVAPNTLLHLLTLINANPEAFFAFSDIRLIDEHGNTTGEIWKYNEADGMSLLKRVIEDGCSPIPGRAATLTRRIVYEKYGHFDESLPFATDIDFLARLLLSGEFRAVHLPEPGYRHRIRYDALLKDNEKRHQCCLKIQENILDQISPAIIVEEFSKKRAILPSSKYWKQLTSGFLYEKLWRTHREWGAAETYRRKAGERLRQCNEKTPDSTTIEKNISYVSPPSVDTTKGPRLGIVSPNNTFLKNITERLASEFAVTFFDVENPQTLGDQLKTCDIAWFEWCESHLEAATQLPKIVPVVCRLHSYEAFGTYPKGINWNRVDRLVFVNETVRDLFCRRFHINHNAVTIPNGLDFSKYQIPDNKQYGKKVAYLGSISYKKGPQMLLQCCKAIHEIDPEYTFHIAGDFHEMRSRIYIEEMLPRLNSPVTFYGHVDDVPLWLRDKDFIISTSLFESFQYALIEGIACGLMPLVHSWPGSEQIFPKRALFDTPQACATLTKEYEISDRKELAERFREQIKGRFNIDNQVKKISTLLKETLEEEKRGPDTIISKKPFMDRYHLPDFIKGKVRLLKTLKLENVTKKILLHVPPFGGFKYYCENLYAAFKLLNFDVRHLFFSDNAEESVRRFQPDLLITACSPDYLKQLPLGYLTELAEKKKIARLVWAETFKPLDGLHEMTQETAELVRQKMVGDIFFSPVDSTGIEKEYSEWKQMGYPVVSIPMAANPVVHLPRNHMIEYDMGFIGTDSPVKRTATDIYLRPLMKKYAFLIRGDRWGEDVTSIPQNQSGEVYGKVRICPNYHHAFQKTTQFQLNERTFVIPACGGFEIVDETPILKRYFDADEMVQAHSTAEWFDLHEKWLRKHTDRMKMAASAHRRVLSEHTYFDRVFRLLELARSYKETG